MTNAKVSRRSIEAALVAGSLVKVRRGCVAVPEADPTRVAEVAWRAERTCLTLARQLELPVMSGNDQVHVAVSAHRSFAGRHARPARDVVFHYAEPTQAVGPLARAIDTASLCVGRLDQLIMLDAALNRRSLELKALD
ncbi:MAG: hypothetical protein HGA51_05110, partial [Demequinaceae bacterium]|nr:hypothetical protein [Demequinaceae bacterium]